MCCVLHSRKYVKIPNIVNVYRNLQVSGSRQPATIDNLKKMVNSLNDFARALDENMTKFNFFIEKPEYKFKILNSQLSDSAPSMLMKYYPSSQNCNLDVLMTVNQELENIFGSNAPMVKWLFNRYNMLYRHHLEISGRP